MGQPKKTPKAGGMAGGLSMITFALVPTGVEPSQPNRANQYKRARAGKALSPCKRNWTRLGIAQILLYTNSVIDCFFAISLSLRMAVFFAVPMQILANVLQR